jgi:hypothetical protein
MAEKEYDYRMKIKSIKIINITALFSSPINHLFISPKDILEVFKTGDPKKDTFNVIEAPGLKVMVFPEQKKEIVFEGNRLVVNDKSEKLVESSSVVSDFRKILNKNIVDATTKLAAYGFNFDVIAESENSFTDLIGRSVSKIPNISSAGVSVSFEQNSVNYMLAITPTPNDKKLFVVHFNAHLSSNAIPYDGELKKQLMSQFIEFEKTIKNI